MPKRFVPAEVHGFLDFMTFGLFMNGATIFQIKDGPSKTPSQLMGAAVVAYSLLTDYGSKKPFIGLPVLSMKQHLQLDAVLGTWVGLAPWVTGSWRNGWNYWAPQAFATIGEVFFAVFTEIDPD